MCKSVFIVIRRIGLYVNFTYETNKESEGRRSHPSLHERTIFSHVCVCTLAFMEAGACVTIYYRKERNRRKINQFITTQSYNTYEQKTEY